MKPIILNLSETNARLLLQAINTQIGRYLVARDGYDELSQGWIACQSKILALQDMENNLYTLLGE